MKLKLILAAGLLAMGAVTTSAAFAQEKITIWWAKGYYPQEDQGMFDAIKKFEAKNPKYKIDLSLYAPQETVPKLVASMDANNPPDVAYGDVLDFQVAAKWAYENKLADISSLIDPLRAKFEPQALSTTFLYNNTSGKRAYFAFPIKQQTMHIQYWKDMLADAGFKESDIPKDWKGYWSFWCEKVQPAYRQKTNSRVYGTGFPMGVDSSDSFFSFLTFMDAHNVKLVNDSGKLLVDDPSVRQGLISAVTDYTSVYGKGCTPPSSTTWKDPDNNVAFHNKSIIMTHNATISIAAKWLDDANNAKLSQAERDVAKKNYEQNIATAGFPAKPDGSKMTYRSAVKVGVIFDAAKNKEGAKKFVSFLLEDANLTPYVEASLGRWFPVTKAGQQSAFWKKDAHRTAVYNQFMAGTTPFEFTKNYKFTTLNNENVWAKAMNRVLSEKWPVDKAVDEMIARIKTVAGN
ncbi:MAG: ABC transporter substrate-binding protein [Cytophagales bacterium]|nr:ABC transporter substrate-binding protein [Cytophagales bacterium]